jgi:hypothetical protein
VNILNKCWHVGLISFLFFLTILSMVSNGYQFGIGDQVNYLPYMYKIVDPELFNHDYFLLQSSAEKSIWVLAFGELGKKIDIERLFFFGFAASLFLYFAIAYSVSFSIFRDRAAAVFFLFFLFVFKPLGTGDVLSVFFHMKSLAVPAALGVCGLLIARHRLSASFVCGLCFLIHPITSLLPSMVLVSSLVWLVIKKELPFKLFVCCIGLFLLVISPLVVLILKDGGDTFSIASTDWMSTLRSRNPYLFLSEWSIHNWFRLFLGFSLCWIGWFVLRKRLNNAYSRISEQTDFNLIFGLVVLTSVLLHVVAFLFTEVIPVPLVFQFQPARSSLLVLHFGYLLISYVLFRIYIDEATSFTQRLALIAGAVLINWTEVLRTDVIVFGGLILVLLLFVWSGMNIFGVMIISALGFVLFSYIEPINILTSFYDGFTQFILNTLSSSRLWLAISIVIVVEAFVRIANRENKSEIRTTTILLTIGISTLIPSKYAMDSLNSVEEFAQYLNYPGKISNTPWRAVQIWLKVNTGKGDIVLIPPDTSGFRVWSKRNSVGDRKDGGPATFSEEFSREWGARMSDLKNYDGLALDNLCRLGGRYHAKYAIISSKHRDFDLYDGAYSNIEYKVVQLGDDSSCSEKPPHTG